VDGVMLFDDDTPVDLISAILPDVLVKGTDYRIDQVVGREIVEAHGGRVVLVDLFPDSSTTRIVEKMRAEPSSESGGKPRLEPAA
jgi:D-beta-D-heptose 7-phosphate kinase/D-beta-D-heptose 1-phosphate adenosyltransferase